MKVTKAMMDADPPPMEASAMSHSLFRTIIYSLDQEIGEITSRRHNNKQIIAQFMLVAFKRI